MPSSRAKAGSAPTKDGIDEWLRARWHSDNATHARGAGRGSTWNVPGASLSMRDRQWQPCLPCPGMLDVSVDSNSTKELSSFRPSQGTESIGGPAVASLPAKETKASGKNSTASRRQRRIRKPLAPLGTESANQIESDINCANQTEHGLAQWFCQLKEHLEVEAQGSKQVELMNSLRGYVWLASKDKVGCRAVQLALKNAPRHLQEELALELHTHVREAMDSPHANYVIQLVVEIMPVSRSAFVAQELAGIASQVARHRYGCRVIIRLLEHSALEASTISLVNELLVESSDLIQHAFGRFVAQAVLEHGSAEQRHVIADALHGEEGDCEGLLQNASHRNASCVFETAMVYCAEEDKQGIRAKLLGDPSNVTQLAQNQFGSFVLKGLLACRDEDTKAALRTLQEASSELQGSRPGRRILELVDDDDEESVA